MDWVVGGLLVVGLAVGGWLVWGLAAGLGVGVGCMMRWVRGVGCSARAPGAECCAVLRWSVCRFRCAYLRGLRIALGCFSLPLAALLVCCCLPPGPGLVLDPSWGLVSEFCLWFFSFSRLVEITVILWIRSQVEKTAAQYLFTRFTFHRHQHACQGSPRQRNKEWR